MSKIKRNKTQEDQMKKQLFDHMKANDDGDDGITGGVRQAILEDCVDEFNEAEGTDFNTLEMYVEYNNKVSR